MSLIKKLFTAIRGGVREATEAVVDANGIRIFEQEIADAQNALNQAKKNLTEVMAKEMQTKRKAEALTHNIKEHEHYAQQALEKGDETLALEIATKIAEYETQRTEEEQILATYSQNVSALKQQIKDAEKTIKENQRQLSMVKTTESVQQATMAVNSTLTANTGSMASAKASLERIKQRQQDRQDEMQAAKNLEADGGDNELKQKMVAAGIGQTASQGSDVLARLKAKQS